MTTTAHGSIRCNLQSSLCARKYHSSSFQYHLEFLVHPIMQAWTAPISALSAWLVYLARLTFHNAKISSEWRGQHVNAGGKQIKNQFPLQAPQAKEMPGLPIQCCRYQGPAVPNDPGTSVGLDYRAL